MLAAMPDTMFTRYGGFATISKVVMDFYDRVLDSDVLARYFDGVDLRRLIDHQTKFVASIMGGPASYTDQQLGQLHAHLAIDRRSFDEMVRLFSETLEDHDFSRSDIAAVAGELESRAPWIVTREAQ